MKEIISLTVLLICLLTGCASANLKKSADRDEAIANSYRKPNSDGLEIYYADRYQTQANQKRAEANSMSVKDDVTEGVIDLIFDVIFGSAKK